MRARNMQALTDAIKRRHPGVTIYGKGDDAHKSRVSGHNEDDTLGVKAELQDADSIPEHRALDVMIGPHFTKAQADELVRNLVTDKSAKARLYYIIWNGHIWKRSNGWAKASFTSDPHPGHVHISGWASDDENGADWPAVQKGKKMTQAEFNTLLSEALDNPAIATKMKRLAVSYTGGGIPSGMNVLNVVNAIYQAVTDSPGGIITKEQIKTAVKEALREGTE